MGSRERNDHGVRNFGIAGVLWRRYSRLRLIMELFPDITTLVTNIEHPIYVEIQVVNVNIPPQSLATLTEGYGFILL